MAVYLLLFRYKNKTNEKETFGAGSCRLQLHGLRSGGIGCVQRCRPERTGPIIVAPVTAVRWFIGLLAMVVMACLQWPAAPGQTDFADAWLRDHFVRWHAADLEDPRVLVVDIDEASLTALGPWPWPRQRIADLVENLVAQGARGVALDLVLPETGDAAGDLRLAMLAQHGPVVLGQALDYVERDLPLQVGQLAAGDSATALRSGPAVPATGYIANHAGLALARHAGNIGFVPDRDGMLRRLPLYSTVEGRAYPTLALALFECCAASRSAGLPADFAPKPEDRGFFPLAFSRTWPAYTVVSAVSILQQRQAPITGRLVLIGSSALGLSDRVSTPLGISTAGVMVHASALSNLLDASEGAYPTAWPGRLIATLFTAAVVLMATLGFPRLSALANIAMLGAASVLWVLLAYGMSRHDTTFSTIAPLAANLFLLAVAVPFGWQVSQRRSRRLLGTLHQYIARPVVDELLHGSAGDPLTPRRVDVTTLIADMEGYTAHVASLSMEDAAQLTRIFLDCLTRPVLKYKGMLDTYTGDGLVAFWGAPLAHPEHADLALDAAKEILQEVRAHNLVRQNAGQSPLRVRIGIESGVAMAGDFGTAFRGVYTVVGDSVNTASRLEKVARDKPHDVIIGEGTVNRSTRHPLVCLGEILLRGKEKPTTIYTFAPPAVAETACR